MTKRYEHQTLKCIAEQELLNGITPIYMCDGFTIPRALIEQGNDWKLIEEEKETDWIDELWDDLCKVFPKLTHSDGLIFHNYINKHLPRLTTSEILDAREEEDFVVLIKLAKDKGLLKD